LYKILIQVTIANLAYELLSIFPWHGVFDPYDIVAIITGAILTFLTVSYLKMIVKDVKYWGDVHG
jgi:hypothetical protein